MKCSRFERLILQHRAPPRFEQDKDGSPSLVCPNHWVHSWISLTALAFIPFITAKNRVRFVRALPGPSNHLRLQPAHFLFDQRGDAVPGQINLRPVHFQAGRNLRHGKFFHRVQIKIS